MKKPVEASIFVILSICLIIVVAFAISISYLIDQSESSDIHSISMKDRHFAVLVNGFNESYANTLKYGAEDAADKYNILLQYENLENQSVREQADRIESLIASKVDGIITTGNESDILIQAINKAEDKGIPVVTIGTDAPMSQRHSSVATNYFSAGFEDANAISDLLEQGANIGVITGKMNMLSVMGFKYAIDRFSNSSIKVISSGESNPLKAADQVKSLLNSHPEVNIIYACGVMETIAASKAVVDLNKVGYVRVVGYGNTQEIVRYIKQGIIRSSVVESPYDMGYLGIKTLDKILNDENVSYVNNSIIKIITKENISEYEKESVQQYKKDGN